MFSSLHQRHLHLSCSQWFTIPARWILSWTCLCASCPCRCLTARCRRWCMAAFRLYSASHLYPSCPSPCPYCGEFLRCNCNAEFHFTAVSWRFSSIDKSRLSDLGFVSCLKRPNFYLYGISRASLSGSWCLSFLILFAVFLIKFDSQINAIKSELYFL